MPRTMLPAPDHRADPSTCRSRVERFGLNMSSLALGLGLMGLAGGLTMSAARAAASMPPSISPRGAGTAAFGDPDIDRDGDGVEDILQSWRRGEATFSDLRVWATASAQAARAASASDAGAPARSDPVDAAKAGDDGDGAWSRGHLRLLCLDVAPGARARDLESAAKAGFCKTLFATANFGGVTVLEVDEAGLRTLLDAPNRGRLLLDRDGVPALDLSRRAIGAERVETGAWRLGNDGSFSLAILDSGCDTAHDDLGDPAGDNLDGPPPAVGDAGDWYPAGVGWPVLAGYKVVGWHDVTDDFPAAAGPWDYHHHGTALASVAAGRGVVAPTLRGVASGARLVVVKYYDFDLVWHAWAGDFLAACDWVLQRRDTLRIGPVLMAVNWDQELGIAAAVNALADAGLTPVAAMGNYGTDGLIGWPARLPSVLTVGAVNDAGAVAAFSGRGGWIGTKPDLVAPGGGLLGASGRIECADSEPNDTYSGRWGTSLAAAHVAGAVHLLDEALGEQGAGLPRALKSVRTRQTVLRLTAAPVTAAETADGNDQVALPKGTAPRDDRGWGLLRIDAAVQALLVPLRPGIDQTDSLLAGGRQPVVARRLDLQPGVRYLIEALPGPGVDIELVVADPRAQDVDRTDLSLTRLDEGGAGTSEFVYLTAGQDSWHFLAVKRLSGAGVVVLRVREAAAFPQQSAWRQLPGVATGHPTVGTIGNFSGLSFVVPSLVAADPVARSVNLLGTDGNHRPGWPVFVFPNPSAQGGLNLPLVWDLDGVAGDEIVLSSGYGSVYFFNGSGTYQTVNLALNRGLTAPVGFVTASGQKRVLVVDDLGNARTWRHGPVLESSVSLGHAAPLPPAVGTLTGGSGESIVVAFADGTVTALDELLAPRPGWPRSLGTAPAAPPVLCDFDGDGRHEVVVPVLTGNPGSLSFRVLDGGGEPAVGDRSEAPAPTGGSWRAVSWPVVAGRRDSGELHVGLAGLLTNGRTGAAAAWDLAEAGLAVGGAATASTLPGLHVQATSDQGELNLTTMLLAPPLAWNHRGGWGTDLACLVHLSWYELLYGLTSTPGQSTAWFADTGDADPLAVRRPVLPGGSAAGPVSVVGAALARVSDELLLRLETQDRQVAIMPIADLHASSPLWGSARGDGRNSGAYPLVTGAAAAPAVTPVAVFLQVQPNPGSGPFRFRFSAPGPGPVRLEVYDLRGHRVRGLAADDPQSDLVWDGCGDDGRPLPAGTYLVRRRDGAAGVGARLTILR